MIRIGIVGYGNLGKGVENGLSYHNDMELVGIFTRRSPETLETSSPAYHMDDLKNFKDKIDVLILCGGSRSDIPEQGPELAALFNTVDSFDTHPKIPTYFDAVNKAASDNKNVAIISTGWDPGLFSINRIYSEAVLPEGDTYTFWGKGVSQGHSDAVRRVKGIVDATQYTIPNEAVIEEIREGKEVHYDPHNAHSRQVFAVIEEGADEERIREEIINMPDYFADYDVVEVNFISQDELNRNHKGMPHGGKVIRQGNTSATEQAIIEYGLTLDSNPGFTAAVNIAYARAAARLAEEQQYGAKTVADIAPAYLSPLSAEEIRKTLI